jgi:hypothetical protein
MEVDINYFKVLIILLKKVTNFSAAARGASFYRVNSFPQNQEFGGSI